VKAGANMAHRGGEGLCGSRESQVGLGRGGTHRSSRQSRFSSKRIKETLKGLGPRHDPNFRKVT
jgi:hypothetical protein